MRSQEITAMSLADQCQRSVARTAKAIPVDGEGRLAVGICGYVNRPMRVDALVDAMLRVAPGKQG